jgi:hypothetical protein
MYMGNPRVDLRLKLTGSIEQDRLAAEPHYFLDQEGESPALSAASCAKHCAVSA